MNLRCAVRSDIASSSQTKELGIVNLTPAFELAALAIRTRGLAREIGITTTVATRSGEVLLNDVCAPVVTFVAQGQMAVHVDDVDRLVGPLELVLLGERSRPRARILTASYSEPFVAVTLVPNATKLHRLAQLANMRRSSARISDPVSSITDDVLGVLGRLLHASQRSQDRRILAPLHESELLYRLLHSGTADRLLDAAELRGPASLAPVLEYIDTHLGDVIRVADLAALICLSPSAFSASFSAITGRSPYQFLKDRRLERSRELLRETDADVRTVARLVGYSSSSHFISQFHERYGQTPRSFATEWDRPARSSRMI